MQTYSHFLMTFVANRVLKRQKDKPSFFPPLCTGALLLGSVMPDIPLTLIAMTTISTDLIQGNLDNPDKIPLTMQLFKEWFFHSPWVKTAHNLFHAPIPIVCYLVTGWLAWKKHWTWGPALFWFGCACLLHTLIDIPCHHDDGPLLLFPFDWELRFYSPVSYWDRERFGGEFTIFEHLLGLALIVWLVLDWRKKR